MKDLKFLPSSIAPTPKEPTLEDVISERDRNLRQYFNESPGAADGVYKFLTALHHHAQRKGLRPHEVGVDDVRTTNEGQFRMQFVQVERT